MHITYILEYLLSVPRYLCSTLARFSIKKNIQTIGRSAIEVDER